MKQIENNVAQAVKVIAQAAEQATKTIAIAAAEAVKVTNARTDGDHDTIVEIKTMQGVMLSEIREIKVGSASRIDCLENEKLDIKDSYPVLFRKGVEETLTAHDLMIKNNSERITKIMAYGTAVLVIFAIIEFLLNIYFKFK